MQERMNRDDHAGKTCKRSRDDLYGDNKFMEAVLQLALRNNGQSPIHAIQIELSNIWSFFDLCHVWTMDIIRLEL